MDVKTEIGVSEGLTLDQQVCFSVYFCANQIARLYRASLQPVGLTFTQYLVMLALWKKSPRNMSELAQVLAVEPNTITPVVKRMEVLGLVSRSRHVADERQVQVSVTEKGLNLRIDVRAMQRDLTGRLDMPEEELAKFSEKVRHFADRVTMATREVSYTNG